MKLYRIVDELMSHVVNTDGSELQHAADVIPSQDSQVELAALGESEGDK